MKKEQNKIRYMSKYSYRLVLEAYSTFPLFSNGGHKKALEVKLVRYDLMLYFDS
jgi:hypothetical protein